MTMLVLPPVARTDRLVDVRQAAGGIVARTRSLLVAADEEPFALRVTDVRGEPLLTIGPGSPSFVIGEAWHRPTRLRACRAWGTTVRFDCATASPGVNLRISLEFRSDRSFRMRIRPRAEQSASAIRLELPSPPEEHFFGFGEPWNGSLDQRGKRVEMWVKSGTPDKCAFIPFYLSTLGYGLYVEHSGRGIFDMAGGQSDRCQITFPVRELTTVFFYGPEFPEIIQQYTALTGRPPMPPAWHFMLARWLPAQASSQEVILADARRLREHGIPAGVIWLEPQWMSARNSWDWNTEAIPNPPAMLDELREMHYRVALWTVPYNDADSPTWQEGLERGYYLMDETGAPMVETYLRRDTFDDSRAEVPRAFVDFTNPDAVRWWQRQIKRIVDQGVSGFKLDGGQHIPAEARFHNGERGDTMHNAYGYYYCKAFYDLLRRETGGDMFMLPRAGSLGSQSVTTFKWPGDLNADFSIDKGLPAAIIAAQSAGLAGFAFWMEDIGGWEKEPDTENFLRWAEFAAFNPGMETPRAWYGFGDEAIDIFRRYVDLHTRLLPYILSYGWQAHHRGLPIIRPLVFRYRTDPNVYGAWDEFLFGDWLLVAPVCEAGARSRQVYLPAGEWIDFWQPGVRHAGPATIDCAAPLDRIPVFVRAGAIIPMFTSAPMDAEAALKPGELTIRLYPAGKSRFDLYHAGRVRPITCARGDRVTRVNLPALGPIARLEVYQDTPPLRVLVDGKPLPRSRAVVLRRGWRWHEGRVEIALDAGTPHTVKIE